jgi:predicted RNase H-like HicB family nuclease
MSREVLHGRGDHVGPELTASYIAAHRVLRYHKDEPENVMYRHLTAIIEREGDGYVALCPELDIASQGETIESARDNLREALELFFESASTEEIKQRLHHEVYVTRVEIAVG